MLNKITIAAAFVALASVAFADPRVAVTLDDAKYYDSTIGALSGADPDMRGALAAGACADIPACADGCAPFLKLIPGDGYSSAEEYKKVLKVEAVCRDGALKALLNAAAREQWTSGDQPESHKKARRFALDRFVAFYERARPLLEPSDQEQDDCLLQEMKLRSKRLDHGCKARVAPQYTTWKAPWGRIENRRYLNQRANITAQVPASAKAELDSDGDSLKIDLADGNGIFLFRGAASTAKELEGEVRTGLRRSAERMPGVMKLLLGSPGEMTVKSAVLPLGSGFRGTLPIAPKTQSQLAITAVSLCGDRASAVFVTSWQTPATEKALTEWQQSFRQSGACDATEREEIPDWLKKKASPATTSDAKTPAPGPGVNSAKVVIGAPTVRGPVDKEIVLRILRRHENEANFCYQKELMKQPALSGEVSIQFTISPAGAVTESVAEHSTTRSSSVDQCLADAVRRWEFPKDAKARPTVVSYPVILKTSGAP